jgi:hypothetical protein
MDLNPSLVNHTKEEVDGETINNQITHMSVYDLQMFDLDLKN